MQINIEKRHLFIISALIVFLAGVVLVNSYTFPANFVGHGADGVWIDSDIVGSETDLQSAFTAVEARITGGIICPETPSYTSGVSSATPDYVAFTFPVAAGCTSNVGCVIVQKIRDSSKVVLSRQYAYNQDASDLWWSSYQTKGTFKNGDGTSTQIVPNYNSGKIGLLDDLNTLEIGNAAWVVRDNSGTYGQDIYVCAYA